jgi:hypothetical protein
MANAGRYRIECDANAQRSRYQESGHAVAPYCKIFGSAAILLSNIQIGELLTLIRKILSAKA